MYYQKINDIKLKKKALADFFKWVKKFDMTRKQKKRHHNLKAKQLEVMKYKYAKLGGLAVNLFHKQKMKKKGMCIDNIKDFPDCSMTTKNF